MRSFTVTEIGTVRSSRTAPSDTDWDRVSGRIELDENQFSGEAVLGLETFSHVQVTFVMHRVEDAKIVTGSRHPKNNEAWPRVGIFAQRGKNRPNRLGTTVCRVTRVDGLTIFVDGLDAIDGTPVVDIKPWFDEYGPRGPVVQPAWVAELMEPYWGTRR